MTTASAAAAAPGDEEIRPVPADSLSMAAEFLFACYASDPEFAALFGLSADEVRCTLPVFQRSVQILAHLQGCVLGCYRDRRLLGVVVHAPIPVASLARVFLRHPVLVTAALARNCRIHWRHPLQLPRAAVPRWRAYGKLARSMLVREPSLVVQALGVDPAEQRRGVARRLLAAMAADRRWRGFHHIQVQTWHAANVEIYRRLGFTPCGYGTRAGVKCWGLVRRIERDRART